MHLTRENQVKLTNIYLVMSLHGTTMPATLCKYAQPLEKRCQNHELVLGTAWVDSPCKVFLSSENCCTLLILPSFQAALWHPRLFNTVVGIDPVIEVPQEDIFPITANPAAASQRRRDIWPDRAAAEKFFRSRPFYKQWDPRVLDLHLVR